MYESDNKKAARTNKRRARLFVQTYIKASTHEDTLKGREKKIHEKPILQDPPPGIDIYDSPPK